MTSELFVKMSGEEAQVFSLITQLITKTADARSEFARTTQSSNQASRAAQEAVRQQQAAAAAGKRIAEQLVRENENLAQSHQREAAAIKEAGAAGKLTADQQKTALAQLEAKYASLSAAQQKQKTESSAAWQQHQRDVQAGIATVARLEASTQTLGQKHEILKRQVHQAFMDGKISADQYEATLRRIDTQTKTLGQSQEMTIGQKAISQLSAMATGYLSISSAIQVATESIRAHNEEKEKGRTETERLEESTRLLQQVSRNDLQDLIKRADAAATQYGVDRSVSRRVLFQARSEGFEQEFEQVLRVKPIIAPEAAARIAGQVRNLYGGKDSAEAMIAAVTQSSQGSRLNIEDLSRALPIVAAGGRNQNAQVDESLAALAELSNAFKTGEVTGDRLGGLLSKMALDARTSGRGLLGGLEVLKTLQSTEWANKQREAVDEAFEKEKEALRDAFESAKFARETARVEAMPDSKSQTEAARKAAQLEEAQHRAKYDESIKALDRKRARDVAEAERLGRGETHAEAEAYKQERERLTTEYNMGRIRRSAARTDKSETTKEAAERRLAIEAEEKKFSEAFEDSIRVLTKKHDEQKKAIDQADIGTFLGESKELNEAFAAMKEYETKIRERAENIQTARLDPNKVIAPKLKEHFSDPKLAYLDASQRAEVSRQIASEEQYSASAARNKAFQDFMEERATRLGKRGLTRWLDRRSAELSATLTGDASKSVNDELRAEFHDWLLQQEEQTAILGEISKKLNPPDALITRPGKE